MMRLIFAMFLGLILSIPGTVGEEAAAGAPESTPAQGQDSLKHLEELVRQNADIIRQLKSIDDKLNTKLTGIENRLTGIDTKEEQVRQNVSAVVKLLQGMDSRLVDTDRKLKAIERNTKSTWNATFWVLILAFLIVIAVAESVRYVTRKPLDEVTNKIERLLQTVTGTIRVRPMVTSVVPDTGPTTGGTPITVEGRNFHDVARILLRENPATNMQVLSSTRIRAVTPPGDAGQAPVTVEDVDGERYMWHRSFTYTAPQELA
jgi:IPT/TIG domain